MCGAKHNAHTEPLLKGCNILKIEDIFKLSCLKLYHKYINRTLPSFFNNIFTMNTDIHSYETRNRDNLHYFPTTGKVPVKELDIQCLIWLIYYPQMSGWKLIRWI